MLASIVLLPACDGGPFKGGRDEPAVLKLDSSSITLPDSVSLVVVTLDRTLREDFKPPRIDVHPGDVVRFEARDGGGHAIAFDGTGLTDDARRFLDATGQLRSPPLLAANNAWVVSFRGGPRGDYPFTCVTHAARGVVRVR